jgi:hypothetical protein
VLKYAFRVGLHISQECLGLFVHYRVVPLHNVVVEKLVEGSAILPPPAAVGHQAKIPTKIHPKSGTK